MKLARRLNQSADDRRNRRSGQALVEMAIVVILMVMLTVAAIDFGVYMYRYVQAANCVREAARRAVVRADDATSPPFCADAGLTPTLDPVDYAALEAGDEVTASVEVDHPWMALNNFIPGLGDTAPITAHTTMRMEGEVAT